MKRIEELLTQHTVDAVAHLFSQTIEPTGVALQKTSKDFEGELTIVVFPWVRFAGKSPQDTGALIGDYLVEHCDLVTGYNVVKGFLNLNIAPAYWLQYFNHILGNPNYGFQDRGTRGRVMVEYSSPNTNKPLHLGHLRNNFLGYSVARILEAAGHEVEKVQIINDRGIHICKSMLAWQRYGNGETPESSGLKGDHLVGKYYVEFDKHYKSEIATLATEKIKSLKGMDGISNAVTAQKELIKKGKETELSEDEKAQIQTLNKAIEEAGKEAPILLEAQEMLRKWEQKDPEVYKLWETMNGWVYNGFEATYKTMGVSFDKLYYESNTYIKGKEEVERGLEKGIFFRKDDGSIWCDLTPDGMDEKLLLRSDGTAVYMTQDIGTAILRFQDFPDLSYQIYTVGNEQEYHFAVLFLILEKLGFKQARNNYHLSYGMVELPSGKMKSREGTVVDADDLMQQMAETAQKITTELGKLEGMNPNEKQELFHKIGMGALKYFLLRVDPKRNMLFDPEESVDFNGNTGPYIQYNYVRTRALINKYDRPVPNEISTQLELSDTERALLMKLHDFPVIIEEAAKSYDPSVVASYCYDLVREYASFYQSNPILKEPDEARRAFRVALSARMGDILRSGMGLLGIEMPDRM